MSVMRKSIAQVRKYKKRYQSYSVYISIIPPKLFRTNRSSYVRRAFTVHLALAFCIRLQLPTAHKIPTPFAYVSGTVQNMQMYTSVT